MLVEPGGHMLMAVVVRLVLVQEPLAVQAMITLSDAEMAEAAAAVIVLLTVALEEQAECQEEAQAAEVLLEVVREAREDWAELASAGFGPFR